MTLATASEFAGLVIAVGGVGVGVQKGVSAMRRFARFLDSWFGDGSKHPSVPDRLAKLESSVTELTSAVTDNAKLLVQHVDTDVPGWRKEGEAWGHRLDVQVAQLDTRVSKLEGRSDPLTPVD